MSHEWSGYCQTIHCSSVKAIKGLLERKRGQRRLAAPIVIDYCGPFCKFGIATAIMMAPIASCSGAVAMRGQALRCPIAQYRQTSQRCRLVVRAATTVPTEVTPLLQLTCSLLPESGKVPGVILLGLHVLLNRTFQTAASIKLQDSSRWWK